MKRVFIAVAAKLQVFSPGDRIASNYSEDGTKPGEWWLATLLRFVKDYDTQKLNAEIRYDTGHKNSYTQEYLKTKHIIQLPRSTAINPEKLTWDQVQALKKVDTSGSPYVVAKGVRVGIKNEVQLEQGFFLRKKESTKLSGRDYTRDIYDVRDWNYEYVDTFAITSTEFSRLLAEGAIIPNKAANARVVDVKLMAPSRPPLRTLVDAILNKKEHEKKDHEKNTTVYYQWLREPTDPKGAIGTKQIITPLTRDLFNAVAPAMRADRMTYEQYQLAHPAHSFVSLKSVNNKQWEFDRTGTYNGLLSSVPGLKAIVVKSFTSKEAVTQSKKHFKPLKPGA